jgi:hypothetical protein
MHRTLRPALVAGVTAALLTAGCATTVTGAPAPAGASSPAGTAATQGDPVAWVNGVCGSLVPFVKAASVPPNVNPSDPKAAITGLGDYLGQAVTSLDTALNGLKSAGPSPVAGGDEVVTTLTTALTKFRSSFQDAKTKIDAVDPNNLTEVATALPEALAPLQELSDLKDPTADLKSSPELEAAAKKAPNCQVLSINGN